MRISVNISDRGNETLMLEDWFLFLDLKMFVQVLLQFLKFFNDFFLFASFRSRQDPDRS